MSLAIDPEGSTSNPTAPQIPVENVNEKDVDSPILEKAQSENKYVIEKDGNKSKIVLPSIIVQGQLGKIITKELNSEFKIDEDSVPDISEFKITDDNNGNKEYSVEGYVYATDMKSLNELGVMPLLDKLSVALEQHKAVYCYIEANDKISNQIGIIESFMMDHDIILTHSIDTLKAKLKVANDA